MKASPGKEAMQCISEIKDEMVFVLILCKNQTARHASQLTGHFYQSINSA